jgi:hypothetical protein
MLKRKYKGLLLLLTFMTMSMTLSGCLFGDSLSVSFFEDLVVISITGVTIGSCEEMSPGEFECITAGLFTAFETLTIGELMYRLILLDPLVVQLPVGATNFNGSYLHIDSSTGDQLDITAGLSSINLDANRVMTAEPGQQFVIIGLPEGAPTSGDFAFNLNFQVPLGTTSLEVKPIITGLAELTDGTTYYPPVFPCVHDMADAPSISTSLPVPGDILTLPPLTQDMACDGVVYDFIPNDFGNPLYLPLVVKNDPGTLLAVNKAIDKQAQ